MLCHPTLSQLLLRAYLSDAVHRLLASKGSELPVAQPLSRLFCHHADSSHCAFLSAHHRLHHASANGW